MEELLAYWKLEDADDLLEELEEVLIVSRLFFLHLWYNFSVSKTGSTICRLCRGLAKHSNHHPSQPVLRCQPWVTGSSYWKWSFSRLKAMQIITEDLILSHVQMQCCSWKYNTSYWNKITVCPMVSHWQASDFGPKTSLKIVDSIRADVKAGKIKTPTEIRSNLKQAIKDVLQPKGSSSELTLGSGKLAVILVIGVNGGGKTTTIGKLAHKLGQGHAKVWIFPNFVFELFLVFLSPENSFGTAAAAICRLLLIYCLCD